MTAAGTQGPDATGDEVARADPFDLPDWLGTSEVVWIASSTLAGRAHVGGRLTVRPGGGAPDDRADRAAELSCDLLAVDQAWPRPVVEEQWRRLAHGEWNRGEVLLLHVLGRLTLATPGTAIDAGRALEAVGRLARAVGVAPAHFLVALRP